MNELQLFSVMRKIIMEVTGVDECIFGDVSEIAPRGEYAAVRVMSTVQATSKGKVTTVTNAEARTVTTTIKVPVMYSVTVNFYRVSAMERAIKLINCSRLPNVHMHLLAAGLGWVDSDPVQNLTGMQSATNEKRAVIVIRLTGFSEVSSTVNTIEQVDLNVSNERSEHLQSDHLPRKM